jgi:hypothetical protein
MVTSTTATAGGSRNKTDILSRPSHHNDSQVDVLVGSGVVGDTMLGPGMLRSGSALLRGRFKDAARRVYVNPEVHTIKIATARVGPQRHLRTQLSLHAAAALETLVNGEHAPHLSTSASLPGSHF